MEWYRIILIDVKTLRAWQCMLCLAWAGLLCTGEARAALAGDWASVQSDAQAFSANTTLSSQTANGAVTVYTQALPNGVVVRQYVDATGFVFAVGWDGPVMPDFVRLLGDYFPSYQEALRQQRRGVSVNRADLVLEAGGAMRGFYGRAWLPARLPSGFTGRDIR